MAVIAVGIGWICNDWGRINLGWVNIALGSTTVVAGIALVVWSVTIQYTLGKGTPAPKVATLRLVTQGPYAYTRNPMTLGSLLIYLGIGIGMGSGALIILNMIVFSYNIYIYIFP